MSYKPLLALPSPSLFGLTFKQQVALLKRSGFKGIELFLFPRFAKRLNAYRKIAKDADIRLSLHQPWSYEEGGGMLVNKVLNCVGYLPEHNYSVREIIARGEGEVFVGYCDYAERFAQLELWENSAPVQLAFQTACTWNGEDEERKHRMSYEGFEKRILQSNHPIVFDTFHLLEWRFGAPGGKKLAAVGAKALALELLHLWNNIGPDRIVEIHWNDFGGEGGGVDGRVCLPGDGVLALGLQMLACEIKKQGWTGYIVPELSPFLLFPYRECTLVALRKRMEQFFV